MANEFKHKDPGSTLTQTEFIASDGTGHIFDSQAAGDILYASSTTVLKNLAKATDGNVLELASGLPAWTASPTIGSTSWANANHAHAASNSGGTVSANDVSGTTLKSSVVTSSLESLGTLTALTVDDVAVNGKVITMTGSSGDTAVFTVGTDGTLSLVTVDTAAAAANIQIIADGTVDIDSAGVLTLDSGAAINIEPESGSAILLDNTISIDAGVVTGATSITSTAFVGALSGNVTGNASGTAATVTGGTQAAITSAANLATVGTITSGTWEGTTVAVDQGGTGITSFATGIATFLGTSSSANLRSALTDETGTGGAVFATTPTIVTPTIASFANSAHDHADAAGGAAVVSASATVSGIAELATTAETNTGTDTGRTVTPDGLAGSVHGEKVVQMVCVDFGTALTTGDGKFYFHVPSTLNGMNIVDVHAEVISAPAGSTIIIDLYNVNGTGDILSTNLTIDAGETGSDTAATAAVISGSEDDLATNDVIRVDIDQIGSSTAGSGLIVTLICRLP